MVALAVGPVLLSAPAFEASADPGVREGDRSRSATAPPTPAAELFGGLLDAWPGETGALALFLPGADQAVHESAEAQATDAEAEVERGVAAAAVAAAEAVADPLMGLDLRIAVLDRVAGEMAAAGLATEPTYTASLSKLVLAVDLVDRRRTEGLVLTERDLDLLHRALGPSDDGAMNALWSRFDGAHAASRVAPRLGLTATADPADPSQWGEMLVSANDQLRLYDHVLAMPEPDRDLLLAALEAPPPVARDGFDQDFGLLAPGVADAAGAEPLAKQGWMCCFDQQFYLHSAGLLGDEQRFVVAMLSLQPRSAGWETARDGLDAVAAAVSTVVAGAVLG